MVLLVLASGYAVHRGISQELRVARLQSDFVAAVSHEFRSPLTTLRTITELLAQDRIRLRNLATGEDREIYRTFGIAQCAWAASQPKLFCLDRTNKTALFSLDIESGQADQI